MKIIIDAFGGDHAPLEVVRGAVLAHREYGLEVVLVGNKPLIEELFSRENLSMEGMEIVHAAEVIEMDADPAAAFRGKNETSMAVGMNLLKEGAGDGFVSGGNTGALLVGGTLLLKRIPGIRRAALPALLPARRGSVLLLDVGASIDCTPEQLVQFGVMGSLYMEKVMGIPNPRVGLINNGSEPSKGGELRVSAYRLFETSGLNFVGNIEGRDLPEGVCDVAVTDGFTGNVMLKLTEGLAGFFMGEMKEVFMRNTASKLSAAVLKPGLKNFKKKLDYTETGGAPLLGLSKVVVKAHGSSNANAFKNAIRQAGFFAGSGIIEEIRNQAEKAPFDREEKDSDKPV